MVSYQLFISLSLCIVFTLFTHSNAQYERPQPVTTYPPDAKDITAIEKATSYKRYDDMAVYLHTYNWLTGHHQKAAFYPRVDEFTQVEIPGSDQVLLFNPNLTVWFEVNGYKTDMKHIYDRDKDVFISYWTVVIDLNAGKLNGIQYDEGCKNCHPDQCIDNVCGVGRTKMSCNDEGVDCNVKAYLAWFGHDANNFPCTSINSIPSAFQRYSLTPVENFGNGLYDDFIYRVKNVAPPLAPTN
eukprot:TRINITY_DN1605_c0_g1_i1.p1 TRINITY_DN1605_c0_g1~~TRINITY_DN1605_c0_g1_i1.p1  ORF type:complete len:241 (+),score=37.30 TRINITY_DN1605_c0_g1_i1:212-934(+)